MPNKRRDTSFHTLPSCSYLIQGVIIVLEEMLGGGDKTK